MTTALLIRALAVCVGFLAGFYYRSLLGPEPVDPKAWRNWRTRR